MSGVKKSKSYEVLMSMVGEATQPLEGEAKQQLEAEIEFHANGWCFFIKLF